MRELFPRPTADANLAGAGLALPAAMAGALLGFLAGLGLALAGGGIAALLLGWLTGAFGGLGLGASATLAARAPLVAARPQNRRAGA